MGNHVGLWLFDGISAEIVLDTLEAPSQALAFGVLSGPLASEVCSIADGGSSTG
jgi:hypothetical protein